MPLNHARYITQEHQADLMFSVCTLVASEERYQRLLLSFERLGFTPDNSEFIACDNRDQNRFEGFRALRRVFPECRGKYLIFVHDDVELVSDGYASLVALLEDLDVNNSNWTLAGNAGWTCDGRQFLRHLEDPHGSDKDVNLPVEVQSLDENFLVMPMERVVFPSLDLSGFHLFATDMCIQGMLAGGSAHIIPFYVRHNSPGYSSESFDRSKKSFDQKYSNLKISSRIRSPASTSYFGSLGGARRAIDQLVDYLGRKKNYFVRIGAVLTNKTR